MARTTVYKYYANADLFAWLEMVDEEDWDVLIGGVIGTPLAGVWGLRAAQVNPDDIEAGKPVPDFVSFAGDLPVLSDRALALLDHLIRPQAEILPLTSDAGDFWLVNVLATVDLMDEGRSEVDWLEPGRAVTLRRLVSRRDHPRTLPAIFALPQWRGHPLITDDFVDVVLTHELTGLDPRPLLKLDVD